MKIATSFNSKVPEGKPLCQYLAAFTGTLTIVTSGMHYGWPSPSLPILERLENSTLTMNHSEGSWMAVMPLLGALIGSLLAATVVDILGRKRAILLTCFPFFAAWIMIAFSQSLTVLYIARFIAGIADGWAFTAVPMYIGEIADPKIRGLLGSGVSSSWIFGILLINAIGSYLSITITALVSSIVPVLTLLTFVWMPESPYYLVMRGHKEEAKCNLQRLRGLEDVDSELTRVSLAVKAQTQNSGKFLDLFVTKSNRKAVYIIMALRGAQQLSGTTAITFYTQLIFEEAGDDISSELATVIYFSVQFLLTILCSSIVDKAGRRPLLVLSLTGSACALFLEGTYFFIKTQTAIDVSSFTCIPVISLIGFVIFFSSGMQSIPILMLGELFPANVKAFALCLADIYFCLMATVVSKFFQIVKDSFGIYVPFYVFTGSCLLGLVFIVLFVPETKGKSLEEIQQYLGGKTGKEGEEKSESEVV
ncbi:facilitated trehalose transporter Tret1 [Tribolium castaneum]|uniref:Facilitated trehalose transporter Tret1-2 homolog-like Protein n=1 Tax=Tribolium castaneum TaxID=7070 RepID=D6WET6_TRICA|nr:PREDICTED: facilitated trehalose transporter Tret1 [Tribolium castaneum]EFA00434.1 Facilitated trehalose transporter Tret1-2 homolog-like Protein [Tribolium castaneum]|eukprot:XP_974372.1 PREDICTED: facilitated trehalose transporter Tret1 [Tribolium castaneum]